MRIAAVALTLLVCCATESGFRERADRRVGQDVNQLLRDIGPPTNEYVMPNGNKLLTWVWVGSTVVTHAAYVSVAKTRSCSLTFEIQGERVISYRYEGRCRG